MQSVNKKQSLMNNNNGLITINLNYQIWKSGIILYSFFLVNEASNSASTSQFNNSTDSKEKQKNNWNKLKQTLIDPKKIRQKLVSHSLVYINISKQSIEYMRH